MLTLKDVSVAGTISEKSTLLLMDVYCTVWVHVACKVVGMINGIVEKEKRNQWSFQWIYDDFWNKLSHTV